MKLKSKTLVAPFKRVKIILIVAMLIILTGVIGYKLILDLGWLDSLYMTVITLATVGFGEVKTFTPAAKLFTILLILGGVGILAYSFETIVATLTDPKVAKYFKNIDLDKKVRRLENHYIICGLGRVGSHVAEQLSADKAAFVCIEKNPKIVESGISLGWTVIEDDATDDNVLYMAGIEKANGLICTMDSDVNNLYVTLSARSIRQDLLIITRVVDDKSITKFKNAGASQVISPYSMLGKRIARSILKPTISTMLDLALNEPGYDFHLEEVYIEKCTPICNKSIQDSGIKKKTGASIVSIVKEDKRMMNNPSPDELIEMGDTLILIGTSEQLRMVRDEILSAKP